jgi:hypothetical protein
MNFGFATLSKVDTSDDGTIIVSGIASTEDEDNAGEIVTADAIKAALPDYLRDGTGALREMHQPKAAGSVKTVKIDAQRRTVITAHVVDPVAIKKIKSGVYKGLSIGGKVLARASNNAKKITKISLSEISLCDRPMNPKAVLDLWKADISLSIDDIRKAMDAMTPDERALLLIKATYTQPRTLGARSTLANGTYR